MTDAELRAEIDRLAGKGLRAAAIFLKSRVRELLSTPAPRKRVLGQRGAVAGIVYYRALTAASPGAPPRKLSGRLRASITCQISADGLRARVGSNAAQARRLEFDGHPYLIPAYRRWKDTLARIVSDEIA